jgi:hypothetical protein
MGRRIIRAIEWLLLDFEERLVTFMIWLCWILGITTDEVEAYREKQKGKVRRTTTTHNPRFPPEPRMPPRTATLHKPKD